MRLHIRSAMRQLYLQQGGSDPVILAQMREMESEARGISKKSKYKKLQGNYIKIIETFYFISLCFDNTESIFFNIRPLFFSKSQRTTFGA